MHGDSLKLQKSLCFPNEESSCNRYRNMAACRIETAVLLNKFEELSGLLIHEIRIKCNFFTNA